MVSCLCMLEELCKKQLADDLCLSVLGETSDSALNKLKCPHCNYIAKHRRTLKRHLIIHSGVRSFSCDICGKLFTRREHVKRHSLVRKTHLYLCCLCLVWYFPLSDPPSRSYPPPAALFCLSLHLNSIDLIDYFWTAYILTTYSFEGEFRVKKLIWKNVAPMLYQLVNREFFWSRLRGSRKTRPLWTKLSLPKVSVN